MPTFVADEIVTATKLNAATARDWAPWTPTLTGITLGNGTVVARYIEVGKLVVCYFEFTFGSSGSAMGSGEVTPPVAPSSNYFNARNVVGLSRCSDVGFGFLGTVRFESATSLRPVVASTSLSHLSEVGLSSTVPMTWASGDKLMFTATYEAA